MNIISYNSTIRGLHLDSAQSWIEAMQEVTKAIEDMTALGCVDFKVRWINEINEITPMNCDRNLWFFRVLGKDAEAMLSKAFIFRCQSLKELREEGKI